MKMKTGTKNTLLMIAGIVITLLFLFPLYWMITTSLRPPGETFSNPSFFPSRICMDSYVLENEHGVTLFTYLKNSCIVSIGATLITMALAIPASYGLARFKNRMISVGLFVFLVAQMLPSSLILTPLFVNFSKLGLINNHVGVMLADATITIPFAVIILRTYFKDIPKELEEAAMVDGASDRQIFRHITLPLMKPVLTVGILLRAMEAFKEFDKLYVLTGGGPGNATEVIDLYTYRQAFVSFKFSYAAAICVVLFLILICCGIIYQRVTMEKE